MKLEDKIFYQKVSNRLKAAVDMSKYKLPDISNQLGIPYSRLYRIVTGDQYVSLIDYVKLCMFLGVPFETFIFEEVE